MIKALIGRGIGFTSGTKYIATGGLSSGAAAIITAIMTPMRGVWGSI